MDWYNVTLQRWVKTSILGLDTEQRIVEPVFIAEDTVVSAHGNGRIAFAKFNETLSPKPKVFRALKGQTGLQMITAVVLRDKMWICVSSLPTAKERPNILVITRPIQVKDNEDQPAHPSQRRLKHVFPGLAFLAVSVYVALLWEGNAIRPMEIPDAMAIYRLVMPENVAIPVVDAPVAITFPPRLGGVGRVETSINDIPLEYAPPPIDIPSTQHMSSITPIITLDIPERRDVTTLTEYFATLFLTETATLTETTSLTETITELLATTQIVTQTVITTVTEPARASSPSIKETGSFNWAYPILMIFAGGLFVYFCVDEGRAAAMAGFEEKREHGIGSSEAPKRETSGEEIPRHTESGTVGEEPPTPADEQITSERPAEVPEEAEIPWGAGLQTIIEEGPEDSLGEVDGRREAIKEVGDVPSAGGMKAESSGGGKQDMDEVF